MIIKCVTFFCFALITGLGASRRNCTIRGVQFADDNQIHYMTEWPKWFKCRDGQIIAYCSFSVDQGRKMIEANSNDYIETNSRRYGCRAGNDFVGRPYEITTKSVPTTSQTTISKARWPNCTHAGVDFADDNKMHIIRGRRYKCRGGQVIAHCVFSAGKVLEANSDDYIETNGLRIVCVAGKDHYGRPQRSGNAVKTVLKATTTTAPIAHSTISDCVLFDGTGLKLWESADVRVSENLGRRYRCTKRGPKQTRCVYFESQTSDAFVKYIRLGQQKEISLHEGKRLDHGEKLRMVKVTCAGSGVPQLDSFV